MKKTLLMLSLPSFTIMGLSEVSDMLVTGGYDKQTMFDAIKHVRKEIDKFVGVMNKKNVDTFAVKAPITDHGRTEHFWLTDVTYSNDMFIGIISNDPGIVISVEYGWEWRIKKEDISNWMYMHKDKIYGGCTINPLLVTYSKEGVDELRAKLVCQSAVIFIV